MVKKIHFMLCIFYQNNKKKLSGPHPRLIPSESLGVRSLPLKYLRCFQCSAKIKNHISELFPLLEYTKFSFADHG